ncbi:MAG TPA: hypothetical protein VNZ53_58160, partial [Steroidobacteraceae bacterium]|nr:hypothetical protein [Steroidobacteraceae bacterium]
KQQKQREGSCIARCCALTIQEQPAGNSLGCAGGRESRTGNGMTPKPDDKVVPGVLSAGFQLILPAVGRLRSKIYVFCSYSSLIILT